MRKVKVGIHHSSLSTTSRQVVVGCHAGLCGSSLHIWYKAVFQELLQQWCSLASQVSKLHKAKWALTHQQGVDDALQRLKQCSKTFSALLALNKVHIKRIQVRSFAADTSSAC